MDDQFATQFRQIADVWSKGATTKLDTLCDAALIYHMLPFPDMGREELKQFIASFHTAFPDFRLFQDEDLSIGSTSIHRWTISGTFTGQSPLLPIAPTGKPGRVSGCHIIRWNQGRAAEVWHYGDWLGWLQQIGVLPSLG